METLFDILTTQQWLAILRIGIGLWWIKSVWHKEYPKFVQSGMMNWTNALLDNHPWPAYANFQRKIINFQPKLFPYLIVLGELAVGLGLTLGILTPIAVVAALFLNFNYITVSGVRPKDITINECFRVDQGQNYVMIVSEIVMLFTISWAVWSLDSIFGFFGA